MNKTISPFTNESESLAIGDLTIENRMDRTSIYGSIDLIRDKTGLEHARILKALLDKVVQALETKKSLPDKIEMDPVGGFFRILRGSNA